MEASCVIPAFENLDLVGRCVLSAVSQEDIELEVIVSDDSTSDRVKTFVEALARLYPRLRRVEGAKTGNPVDNWNHGLSLATGEMCVLAHHDEFFLDRRYLRRARDEMQRRGAPAVIGPAVVVGVERASRFPLASGLGRWLGRPLWALPSLNWIGPTAAFTFRAGPRFDRDLVQLVDVEFYRRVLDAQPVVVLEGACVGSLGHHAASITARIDPRKAALAELPRLKLGPIEYAAHRLARSVR